jgi:arginyl-tRNA synthetase
MLLQQKQPVTDLISRPLAGLGVGGAPIVLERPKVESHGDIACNVAMQVAKSLKEDPREVAAADALKVNPAGRPDRCRGGRRAEVHQAAGGAR